MQITLETKEVCSGIVSVRQTPEADGGSPWRGLHPPDPCVSGVWENILNLTSELKTLPIV